MLVQGLGAGKDVSAALVPVSLAGDRATALALVFCELLQNALEHGGDAVRIELAQRNGDVVLAIADDGAGIDGAPARNGAFDRRGARARRARWDAVARGRGRASRRGRLPGLGSARAARRCGRRRASPRSGPAAGTRRSRVRRTRPRGLEVLQRERRARGRDAGERRSELGEAPWLVQLGEDRQRPLLQADLLAAGERGEQRGATCGATISPAPREQVLGPEGMAVARVALDEAFVLRGRRASAGATRRSLRAARPASRSGCRGCGRSPRAPASTSGGGRELTRLDTNLYVV